MKKVIVFLVTNVFVCFVFAFSANAAEILENTTLPDGTVSVTLAPDDSAFDNSAFGTVISENADNPLVINLMPGEYKLSGVVSLYSNTTINAEGAIITQTADGKGILINARRLNGPQNPIGKYGSIKNVVINGGTWVCTSNPDTSKTLKDSGYYVGYSTFLFMHGEGITVKNCAFKNNYNGHFVEFAGIKNGKIVNCNMAMSDSKYVGEGSNEAIQIDNCYAKANLPVGSPWDDTPCKDNTISSCKIKYARGIGTNRVGNSFFENIRIEGCNITSTNEGINIYDTLGITINKCTVKSTGKKDDYTSSGVFIGLESKVKNKKKCNAAITGNKITGYHAGLKVCVPKNNTKFNKVTIKGNKLYSRKSKSSALYITNGGKQITSLANKGNTLKKK